MRPSDPMKAIAWMAGALVSFLVMAISVRELSAGMHAFEMLFLRSAIGVAILAAVLSVKGWGRVRTRRLGGHLVRNLVHFAGQTLWIVGIALLPLATVAAIEFTTPIWGVFLAVLFLGERMNRGRWVARAFGILGILVILRPGVAVIGAASLLMLVCTFCFGATNTITKWLTRSDTPFTIVFYMVLMQTLIGALAAVFVWTPVAAGDWPFLVLLGLTGISAHYALTHALAAADATFIMPFEFLRLPFVALIWFWVYSEDFELAVLIGAALIFAGNSYSLRRESRAAA